MFALTVHWFKLVSILRRVLINNYLIKLPFGCVAHEVNSGRIYNTRYNVINKREIKHKYN